MTKATIVINKVEYNATKNEAKETLRIRMLMNQLPREVCQKEADIWMRSAPCDAAAERRKAIVDALGLKAEVEFL